MNKGLLVLSVLSAFCVVGAQAHAQCGASAEVKFSDGAIGCVTHIGGTEITRTQQPYNITHSFKAGFALIDMKSGEFTRAQRTRVLSKRGREVCVRFREEILKNIPKPKHPFMVVVMQWGTNNKSRPADRNIKRLAHSVYLSRNCRAVRVQFLVQ